MPGAILGSFTLHVLHGTPRIPTAQLAILSRPGVNYQQIWKLCTLGEPFQLDSLTLYDTLVNANTAKNAYLAAKAAVGLALSINGVAVADYVFKVIDVIPQVEAIGKGTLAGDSTDYLALLSAQWTLLALPD